MKTTFCLTIFLFSYSLIACPIGPKEDHLTIQRVMRNFGKFSMDAESICITGQSNPSSISDDQLSKAMTKLDTVVACAEAVIAHPEGDLLPAGYDDLNPSDRADMIKKLVGFMSDFKTLNVQFKSLLLDQLQKPIQSREYKTCYEFDKKYNELIDRAHKEVQ